MNAISQIVRMNWVETKVHPFEYLLGKAKRFCDAMSDEINGISAWKILLGVCTFFVATNTSIIGYLVIRQVDIQTKQVALENSTMTLSKGELVLNKLAEIDVKLAAIPKENPPNWLIDLIKRNEARIERLETRIERMNHGGKDG